MRSVGLATSLQPWLFEGRLRHEAALTGLARAVLANHKIDAALHQLGQQKTAAAGAVGDQHIRRRKSAQQAPQLRGFAVAIALAGPKRPVDDTQRPAVNI